MKDLLGSKVNVGDVLLELWRGQGCLSGSDYIYHMKLWEMPNDFDGHAFTYSIDGSKSIFAWAHVEKAIKIDMELMPNNFEYSFKYGMSNISSKVNTGTLQDTISNSNWKDSQVLKEDVERFKYIETLEINSIEDIKDNLKELMSGSYVPHEIVTKVLQLAGDNRVRVYNGEIGIASIQDHMNYRLILELLNQE